VPFSLALLVVAVGLAAFMRDPDRSPGEGIVAAADGRVTAAGGRDVVTFLNVHNVHVVRAPYGGTVTRVERIDGPKRPAFSPGAGHNAGVRIALDTAWGELEMKLLTGIVARRAIAWVRPGERVEKGARVGMIRLGSRVDVQLPDGGRVLVRAGTRVRAGETTIAEPPAVRGRSTHRVEEGRLAAASEVDR
jgi:phosphatidylserine decarboxylase